jgi:C4-dicarboxylate-specific signal transduction histidine kinase
VGFAFVAALPLLFLSAQRYVWVTRELLRDELQQDLALARSVADGLDRYMASRIFLITGMARDLQGRDFRRSDEINGELDRMRERNQGLSTLLVVDTTGTAVASSPRFGQTSSGVKASTPGSGLGLVICRHLIEAHGGRIWAEDTTSGCCFVFHLPAGMDA